MDSYGKTAMDKAAWPTPGFWNEATVLAGTIETGGGQLFALKFSSSLKDETASTDEPSSRMVVAGKGEPRGIALEPLYRTGPAAALRHPALYELPALVDAIRDGRARECKIAERELISRLHAELELLAAAASLLKPTPRRIALSWTKYGMRPKTHLVPQE